MRLGRERYLSREQEKGLLLDALKMDVSLQDAQEIVRVFAAEFHVVLEGEMEAVVVAMMTAFVENDGWITRTEFRQAVETYKRMSGGQIGDREAMIRVKRLVSRNEWPLRGEVIFGKARWFRQIPDA